MKPYYRSKGITIYCGDCREVQGLRADLLCTDPPYGLGAARETFRGNGVLRHMTGLCRGKAVPKRDYGDAAWDDRPVDRTLLARFQAMCRYQVIFGGGVHFDLGPARCFLVWDKLRGNTDYADGELAWTNLDRAIRIIRYRWNGFLKQQPEERWHPTQKPVAVLEWAILQAPHCETILDPFMGVGSGLVAARNLQRKAIGIEIEEKYCEIAARRLDGLKAKKAA